MSAAKRKAFESEELKRAEWHLLELGDSAPVHETYEAANRAVESRGFDDVASDVLLQRSFQENLPRLMAAAGTQTAPDPPAVADALLDFASFAMPPLGTDLTEFIALTKTKHLRKSNGQRHLWRLPRERAIANFEKALPRLVHQRIDAITREEALAFRDWWSLRIQVISPS